jgi:hypothetical protein
MYANAAAASLRSRATSSGRNTTANVSVTTKEVQCWEQPAGAPQPEGLEVDAASLAMLRQQQRGDQVTTDDEEDLDAEEATRDPRQFSVVEEHGDDGECA